MKWNSTAIKRWLRIIHRDLGFLMVGICLVYAISGILLNHMDGDDPAYKTIEETLILKPELTVDQISEEWSADKERPLLKKVFLDGEDHYRLMLSGGIGSYDKTTGELSYEHHKQRPFVYWINKLHYNKINGWTIMADIFAGSLIFLAVSGLFITAKKKGLGGMGKWYLLVGLLIPILYVVLA